MSSLISLDLSNFDASQIINMNSMFDRCSNLKFLDLSNFNASQVKYMYYIFDGCSNLENINLKNSIINPSLTSSSIGSSLPSKLTICSENENWSKIFSLSDKQYVNCINNISSFKINENEDLFKCFFKNDIKSDNPCQICGNNYFNKSGIINNTYINCYDNNYIEDTSYIISIDNSINDKDNYIDNTSFHISINTSFNDNLETIINSTNIININNSYISEDNVRNELLTNQFSDLDYSSFSSSVFIEKEIEIKNRTELINYMINNILNKLNISNIDNGKDEKKDDKNISVIMTSTKNQKKNENKKIITIDLGECENILKNEYNISKNDS